MLTLRLILTVIDIINTSHLLLGNDSHVGRVTQ